MYVYALRQVRIMTGEKVIGDMITVFWHLTMRILVGRGRSFAGTCFLPLWRRREMKIAAGGSSETLGHIYHTTRRHIPRQINPRHIPQESDPRCWYLLTLFPGQNPHAVDGCLVMLLLPTMYGLDGRWMNKYAGLVEWQWLGKTIVFREKRSWDETLTSSIRGRRLTELRN
jgi:hypothetical protein